MLESFSVMPWFSAIRWCHNGLFGLMVCRSAVCVRTHALLAQAFASAVMPECAAHSSTLHVLNGKGCCLKLPQRRLVCYMVLLFDLHLINVFFFPYNFPTVAIFWWQHCKVILLYLLSVLFLTLQPVSLL